VRTDFNKRQEEQRATSAGMIPYPNSNHTGNFKRWICKSCSKSNNGVIFCHLNKFNYLNILTEQSSRSIKPVLPRNLIYIPLVRKFLAKKRFESLP
jgi:hypothetical protein